jgi:hypothetical protein
MATHTATYSFEIELDLSGTVSPGYAGDQTSPPEGVSCEDLDIDGVFGLTPPVVGQRAWGRTDLLAGVDIKNPEVQKILSNILAFVGDNAADAVLESAKAFELRGRILCADCTEAM